MADYVKQGFVDGETLFAAQLNHIEDGISRLDDALLPSGAPVYSDAKKSAMRRSIGAMANTPSGDPLHDTYLLLGATYNVSTARWSIYDMTDVTNEEMRRAVLRGTWNSYDWEPFASNYYDTVNRIRFNVPRVGRYNSEFADRAGFMQSNATIEVFNISTRGGIMTSHNSSGCQVYNMQDFARGCTKLRKILGELRCGSLKNTTNAFTGCAALVDVWIALLPKSISFADSPLLSKECVLYMIQNAGSASIVITLHATVYNTLSVDSDIIAALNSKPNVTLASA